MTNPAWQCDDRGSNCRCQQTLTLSQVRTVQTQKYLKSISSSGIFRTLQRSTQIFTQQQCASTILLRKCLQQQRTMQFDLTHPTAAHREINLRAALTNEGTAPLRKCTTTSDDSLRRSCFLRSILLYRPFLRFIRSLL